MSRAQGDAFKTWTDHELNAYKYRLQAKLIKLIDHKEKWYRAGYGWILVEERNRMTNPNGSWKWNGWEVEAHEYWVSVFPEECVEVKNGKPVAVGWSQIREVFDDDRNLANTFFKDVAQKVARGLKNWMPKEYDNKPVFEYDGRKPSAVILFDYDKTAYKYMLMVDGKVVLETNDYSKCVNEATMVGAELTETHTP